MPTTGEAMVRGLHLEGVGALVGSAPSRFLQNTAGGTKDEEQLSVRQASPELLIF